MSTFGTVLLPLVIAGAYVLGYYMGTMTERRRARKAPQDAGKDAMHAAEWSEPR
jgi:hypothetical protein